MSAPTCSGTRLAKAVSKSPPASSTLKQTEGGTPAEIRWIIEDLGLRTIAFQPFRDFEGMPEPQRSKVFARAERKFDVMQELGCDLLLVCSNVSPDAIGGIDRAEAKMSRKIRLSIALVGIGAPFEDVAPEQAVADRRSTKPGG
jgi:3-dehydroshikimate dehydratase